MQTFYIIFSETGEYSDYSKTNLYVSSSEELAKRNLNFLKGKNLQVEKRQYCLRMRLKNLIKIIASHITKNMKNLIK